MIDFLCGVIVTLGCVYLYRHFKGDNPAKAITDFTNLEARIRQMISDAMNNALAAVSLAADARAAKAVEDYKAANPPIDPQAAVDAKDAEDVEAVQALAAQIAPGA